LRKQLTKKPSVSWNSLALLQQRARKPSLRQQLDRNSNTLLRSDARAVSSNKGPDATRAPHLTSRPIEKQTPQFNGNGVPAAQQPKWWLIAEPTRSSIAPIATMPRGSLGLNLSVALPTTSRRRSESFTLRPLP
jgi:hypothetical protein